METLNHEEYKQYLTKMFQSRGNIHYAKWGPSEIPTYEPEDDDNLFHQVLLIPHHTFICSERWGYSRQGINGRSKELETPILDFTKEAKEIEDTMKRLKISAYTISLIIQQRTY